MLLPQSSAFAALKNRLNSVSAIGYLHIAPRTYVSSLSHVRQKSTELKFGSTPSTPTTNFDRPTRLKPSREEGPPKWGDLLDTFKAVQEKARRASRSQTEVEETTPTPSVSIEQGKDKALSEALKQGPRPSSAGAGASRPPAPSGPLHKPKSSLGHLGRLTGSRRAKK